MLQSFNVLRYAFICGLASRHLVCITIHRHLDTADKTLQMYEQQIALGWFMLVSPGMWLDTVNCHGQSMLHMFYIGTQAGVKY